MAVPTIYAKLIDAWEKSPPAEQRGCPGLQKDAAHGVGFRGLAGPTLERWKEVSGHVLLERYGMTEIGMGISNPLYGKRFPDTSARPCRGWSRGRTDETGQPVAPATPGEIEIRGKTVFVEYWGKPQETQRGLSGTAGS